MSLVLKNHWQLPKTRYEHGVLTGIYNRSWHEALSIETVDPIFENLDPLMSRMSEMWGWKDQSRYNETALREKLAQAGTNLYHLRDAREAKPVIGYALVSVVQQPLKDRFWSAANDLNILEIDNLGLFPGNEGGGRGKAFFEMIFAKHFVENDILYWSQHETHAPTLTRFYREKMKMEHLATDHVPDFRKPAARVA